MRCTTGVGHRVQFSSLHLGDGARIGSKSVASDIHGSSMALPRGLPRGNCTLSEGADGLRRKSGALSNVEGRERAFG